ncbi:bifunctional adenosylcobinamide kinase/adenosylcobinamide-phosphate guanylyltransferase [Shewanella sp. GXUN23E]|uniref:bifunctional adenosylcobinamide kinase/adenosylcobinamide-phosphate guanylyltransferase n=1 Tax=Shewanella sp. GXUN23E TaxID=3422498 RepID=UPI003D7CA553
MIHLILGGARSGKSRFAEHCAAQFAAKGYECHYLATAQALDEEMRLRIDRHRQDRLGSGLQWQTHEVGTQLRAALDRLAAPGTLLLVDCLTLWLTGLLCRDTQAYHEQTESQMQSGSQRETEQLVELLTGLPGEILLVSNEVGSGIVPLGSLSRQFVDDAGRLNQSLAAIADRVTLVVAGLPLALKG